MTHPLLHRQPALKHLTPSPKQTTMATHCLLLFLSLELTTPTLSTIEYQRQVSLLTHVIQQHNTINHRALRTPAALDCLGVVLSTTTVAIVIVIDTLQQ